MDKMREVVAWRKKDTHETTNVRPMNQDEYEPLVIQSVPVVGEPWRWIVNKANGEPLLSLLTCDEAKRYLTDGFVVFPVYRQPTTSITAAELERLQRNDARWLKANEGGKFCISEWRQLPMSWADLTPETAIKRIDEALAGDAIKAR